LIGRLGASVKFAILRAISLLAPESRAIVLMIVKSPISVRLAVPLLAGLHGLANGEIGRHKRPLSEQTVNCNLRGASKRLNNG